MTIEQLKLKIAELNSIIQALETPVSSFEDQVFRKYIELERIDNVAKWLRDNEYRKENGNVYTTNDIRDILLAKQPDVNPIIYELGNSMFVTARKKVLKFT